MSSIHNNENINIAIIGPVSAGKSTLLNGIFSNTFSDMKRKKTTMMPQIYNISDNCNKYNTYQEIKLANSKSNHEILELRESGKYTTENFSELTYNIKHIDDFIKLPNKNISYSIIDMPGLNCSGGGDTIYYDYLSKKSKDIDIYVAVFDINSGLNTTDEIKILQEINNYIETNKYGYLHILINKCDSISFDKNNNFSFDDEEISELYNRCCEIINKYITSTKNFTISPICTSELYVYKCTANNIDTLDEKHIDNIIKNECGKSELKNVNLKGSVYKRNFFKSLIKDLKQKLYQNWMQDTGYLLFVKSLNNILTNYTNIINHHIYLELSLLNKTIDVNNINIDDITNKLLIIQDRINNIEYMSNDVTNIIAEICKIIDNYVFNVVSSNNECKLNEVNSHINKIKTFCKKLKNLFKVNPETNYFNNSTKLLNEKRTLRLNAELSNEYNNEIFGELINNNLLNIQSYELSLINTLNNDKLKFELLFKSIHTILNNCENVNKQLYYNTLFELLGDKYKIKNFDELIDIIKIINELKIENNIVLFVIERYLLQLYNDKNYIYTNYAYWIESNYNKINNNSNYTQYFYYKIQYYINLINSTNYICPKRHPITRRPLPNKQSIIKFELVPINIEDSEKNNSKTLQNINYDEFVKVNTDMEKLFNIIIKLGK